MQRVDRKGNDEIYISLWSDLLKADHSVLGKLKHTTNFDII
jgi:hypothetical protein